MKSPFTTRRFLLAFGASALGLTWAGSRGFGIPRAEATTPEKFEVSHTDEEWQKLLSANQYKVL